MALHNNPLLHKKSTSCIKTLLTRLIIDVCGVFHSAMVHHYP